MTVWSSALTPEGRPERGRVSTVETVREVTDADLGPWLQPRGDLVEEITDPESTDELVRFRAPTGPFGHWERVVTLEPGATPGHRRVTQTVTFRLALSVWSPLLRVAVRRQLRRHPRSGSRPPWWAPSQVIDERAAVVLSLLCVIGAVGGYLGTLITQTLTYAAGDFGATTADQGALLATVRIGVLASMIIVAVADRRGRRVVLLMAIVGACAMTALGALAPGMWWLGATQTVARSLSTVVALLVAIIAVEEMPAGARAFAVSVLSITAAFGAGLCVANLVYVDLAPGAWRVAYLLPLLAIVPCLRLGRRLPETLRFESLRSPRTVGAPISPPLPSSDPGSAPSGSTPTGSAPSGSTGAGSTGTGSRVAMPWGRLALLGASGFLWSLFLAPAAQFLNEFLRTERGFSGIGIAVFVLATNTPGVVGIVLGGRLADRRGRRLIGAVGIAGGVGFTVVAYLSFGWSLWTASMLASVIGAMAVPALAVYGPELFPTALRGRANGALQVVSVAGSSTGLLLVGWLDERLGGLGAAMALVAIGPALLIVAVLTLFPETARRELEDLNPADRPPPHPGPTGSATI